MMKPVISLLLVLLLELPLLSRCCTEYYTVYEAQRYTVACGIWKAFRCTRYREISNPKSRCCDGYTGDDCQTVICNELEDPSSSCSLDEGRVQLRNGMVYTSSGGTCVSPNVCEGCNPGYYVDGSYCKACSEISNCHYASCIGATDSVCNYCEGEIKEQYGWYAYTRFLPNDGKTKCRRACSWRKGSRCYPGSCLDTTTDKCQCIEGFSGPDCDTITQDPNILQNFLKLTQNTGTSTEHIETPPDSGSGSPQPKIWTNNGRLEEFSGHVEALFKKELPSTPEDFYINLDETKVGIINSGIKLELIRDSSNINPILHTCETEPTASVYRCELEDTFSSRNWPVPFQEADIIRLTVFATSGGYVSVYNRENDNKVEKYTVSGKRKENEFEVWFDVKSPFHCITKTPACSFQPLMFSDLSTEATFSIEWPGWEDALSGIESFHFEVFHLKPTGPGTDSELMHGDKVHDAVVASVLLDVLQTSVTLPNTGPYAITITVFDVAGNHKTARRLVLFDDSSVVTLQGSRNFEAGMNGKCTCVSSPSAVIVHNADPNANCDWITIPSSIVTLVWNERFINTKHHNGQWLNPVRPTSDIDGVMDDNDGLRTIFKADNELGVTSFQVAYNVTINKKTTSYPLIKVDDIHAESFSFDLQLSDGMKIDAQVRATDVFGAFADDFTSVKVDTTAPIIEDLWLTKGDRMNITVHNVEDLTKLQIEWKSYDIHSGIEEISWRIFDNFTGVDIDHGRAYLSPQGDAETLESCKNLYGDSPWEPDCYCTPFDGCFHRHFRVIPQIYSDGTNGLHKTKYIGVHDSDFFIEITVTNKALLQTIKLVKITIDTSPPDSGSVHEGLEGEPDIDFQQGKIITAHWQDFFDRESGIMFYRYGYGKTCLELEDFDVGSDKLQETKLTEVSFTVEDEGKYFVTVVAYNHALIPSIPVCSDGVLIDTSIPTISEFRVNRSKVQPRLLQDNDGIIWLLNGDRTRQRVETASEVCRTVSKPITTDQLEMIPLKRNNKGTIENITLEDNDNCKGYTVSSDSIISFVHDWKYLDLSWNASGTISGVYDFQVGLSSTISEVPDIVGFQSSNHHSRLTLSHPNINDGSLFYFTVKSVSRSGIENIQHIGPFLLLTRPPQFEGKIIVAYEMENNKGFLVASWDDQAFLDEQDTMQLTFQVSIGTQKYGTDVYPYSDLRFYGNCKSTQPPTCTAIPLDDLDWDLHHGKEYYVTVRVNNIIGLVTKVSSEPYIYDMTTISAGVVLDKEVKILDVVSDNEDIDYQRSKTEMSARWYGFDHFYNPLRYTACIADDNDQVFNDTCKYVESNTSATLTGLTLIPFKKYKVFVKAETGYSAITAYSDGVYIIDNTKLDGSTVYDGEICKNTKVILPVGKTHHDHDISHTCTSDEMYQVSVHKLASYWIIQEDQKPFAPDLYWHIEKKAPVFEQWTAETEPVHIPSSSGKLSINYPLIPGRSYRFGLQFCAADICFNTLYTSGITVIPSPPKTGEMSVTYRSKDRTITVVFEKFCNDDIEDSMEAQDAIDFYEWNIADNDDKGRIVQKWTRINTTITVNTSHLMFETILSDDIQFTKCWNLLLRGTNKAGSSSVVDRNINPCDDVEYVKPATVIDCVPRPGDSDAILTTRYVGSPIELEVNAEWFEDDKDYTPYNNILSAVWPELRYKIYQWAVIETHGSDPVLYYSDSTALRDPCDNHDKILCGTTDKNYVNVYFETNPLEHGHRYVICIHADAVLLEHEYWKEPLPEISSCSDGITVDITPPRPGDIWIYNKDALYQTSKSEISIFWEKFIDVEELGNHVHESGISHYKVGLGSFSGGVDVISLTSVGTSNHMTFHDLLLQDGHTYFATVVGYDFTGRHAKITSSGIIVDTTAPLKSTKEITMQKRFITDNSKVEACWTGVFSDPDSNMAFYKWGIGSKPGYDDKYAFERTTSSCAQTRQAESLLLEEGHSYYITVMGFNNAELFSFASSWAFTVDVTPPVGGYVNDGERKLDNPMFDIDYQTKRSSLSAYWGGFSDPHTPIKEFAVCIGTSKGAQDVLGTQAVGLIHDITIDHLQLRDGTTYYVTITACNVADMCTLVTSDGVSVDSSPPVAGKVIDGAGDKDIRYQASSNIIGAKWFGFIDPQSGLSHFTWRVGTIPFADDIIPAREVHLHEIAFIPDLLRALNKQLPVGKMLYNTIRAYNKGGLHSEASSNGFIVDNTAPVFTMPLTQVAIGSLITSTSVLRSSLKVKWKVEDSESFISRQYLSMSAHRGDDTNSTVYIGGYVRDHTFTKLQLHDGSVYSVKAIACNGANLCSASVLPGILIDTTPPREGTFAINTDHAMSPTLNRQPENWMVWETTRIHLAWLGFSDIHSGILEYHINIGSAYMSADLNKNPDHPYVISHKTSDQVSDSVQTGTIDMKTLTDNQHVYISIWAVNGVGLKSETVLSQFLLVPGGSMQLIRRCNSYTCQGHCVCAAKDLKCPVDAATQTCVDKTGDTSYSILEVEDVVFLTGDAEEDFEGTHSPTDMMLSARWVIKSGLVPLWYEWSVGFSSSQTPLGIFDNHARVWHDAGALQSWTFTLTKGSSLLEGEKYSFFIRAWFDKNTFSVFKSRGVIIQMNHPETTSIFGKAVKEIVENSVKDRDYVTSTETVLAVWDGKFKNAGTSVSRYRLFISSEPNGHDIHSLEESIPAQITRHNITGLYRDVSTRFFNNIVAYNHAGLHTVAVSDGCEIDDDKPVPGVVFDGTGFQDLNFQNTSSVVWASWQGFVDVGSSLRAYHWCVSPATNVGSCSVLPEEDLGLVNSIERKLSLPIQNGAKVVSEVYANDMVGHASVPVLSDGVIIDVTPPVRQHHLSYGDNLLVNPSFENTNSPSNVDNIQMLHSCNYEAPYGWSVSSDGCAVAATTSVDNVRDGSAFIVLKGAISQTVSGLNTNSFYRFSFYTSHLPLDNMTKSNNEGFVEFGGEKHVFMLYSKPRRADHTSNNLLWHLHTFAFKPRKTETVVTIGSYGNSPGLAVDNVELKESMTTSYEDRNAVGHVLAHTVFVHDWSSVHASWNFVDEESGIREYMWAIGTVQGGVQLQDYKSVGIRQFDDAHGLYLPHNTTIHITVVAINGAGLRTVSYSDPVVVDLTPPVFDYVNDGVEEGTDIDYQNVRTVGVNFKASDLQSGIESCSWAIGTKPGDTSLQQFVDLPAGQFSATTTLQENASVQKLYVIVRCKNKAGLVSTLASDGVTILTDKPSSGNIIVEVLGKSPSQYLAHSYYHGTRDALRIRWSAFEEHHWIQKYKVAVQGPSRSITSYVDEYSPGYTYATFRNLPSEDGLYNITVTGVDVLNRESDPVSTSVIVLTEPPTIKADINITWNSTREEVTVSWQDVFFSALPLYYEVSAGTVRGGGDIIQWQETSSTELIFTLTKDDVGEYGKDIFVVVRAITLSGTYNTAVSELLVTNDD